ncbi:MAG TPA: hypothetical protein VKV79_02540 [Terriglobia bacterium]|nr:hypothetical protein [Terriglobia bacterium]
MDVKQYYRKVREIESAIPDEFPLVVSLETADGGRAGVVSEVSRLGAAKMIVEGRAALAGEEDKAAYREGQIVVRKAAEKAELAKRLQVAIVTESELLNTAGKKTNDSGSGK